ncbi:ATP-binding protein, partial [Pseudomonas aeruginosa]
NLLATALDAMSGQAGRQLWLVGRREEERYVLRVRDNGPGIPPAAVARLAEGVRPRPRPCCPGLVVKKGS